MPRKPNSSPFFVEQCSYLRLSPHNHPEKFTKLDVFLGGEAGEYFAMNELRINLGLGSYKVAPLNYVK